MVEGPVPFTHLHSSKLQLVSFIWSGIGGEHCRMYSMSINSYQVHLHAFILLSCKVMLLFALCIQQSSGYGDTEEKDYCKNTDVFHISSECIICAYLNNVFRFVYTPRVSIGCVFQVRRQAHLVFSERTAFKNTRHIIQKGKPLSVGKSKSNFIPENKCLLKDWKSSQGLVWSGLNTISRII